MRDFLVNLVLVATIILAVGGCGPEKAEDESLPAINELNDLSSNPIDVLEQHPDIVEVTRYGPDSQPLHRIIHIADWHYVERDDYAADLRALSVEPISDEVLDHRFAKLIDKVERVQIQQMTVLQWLIKNHGLKRVYLEGLTKRDLPIFDAKIEALREVSKGLSDLRQKQSELLSATEPDAPTQRILEGIQKLEKQYRRDLLRLGAAGQLVLSGELEGVLPLEDEKAHQAAKPIADNGGVSFDQEKIEARQDGQAHLLLEGGPFSTIILGGAHDLSDNLDRLSEGKAEYIRVEVEEWRKATGQN